MTTFGTRRLRSSPPTADGEMVARLRAAGRGDPRQDRRSPSSRSAASPSRRRWGVTRNPWDPSRTPGGSSGGSAAAVAAGLVGARVAPPTAAARSGSRRPSAACSGSSRSAAGCRSEPARPLARDVGARLRHPHGRRHGALPRRDRRPRRRPGAPPPPERPFAEAAATPPGKLRIAISDKPARAIAAADRQRRGQARRSPRPRSCCARSATTSAATTRLRARRQQLRRPLPAAGSATTSPRSPHPERLEARTRGFGRLGAAYRAGVRAPRRPSSPSADAERDQPQLRALRRAGHPDRRRAADRGRPLGGQGGAADPARDEPHLLLHADLEPHRPAGGRGARPASTPTGCRARCSWSAARATRRRCSRSPPRSRPSGRGPTAGRRVS